MAIVGMPHSGKSTYAIEKIIPLYLQLKRKILIFHKSKRKKRHASYKGIQPLHYALLEDWCSKPSKTGPRFCSHSDKDFMIDTFLQNFDQTGHPAGLLIIDDFTSWFPKKGNLPENLEDLILDGNQINCDIIVMVHSIQELPMSYLLKTNVIVLFKTQDVPYNQRSRMSPIMYEQFIKHYNELQQYRLSDYQFRIISNQID